MESGDPINQVRRRNRRRHATLPSPTFDKLILAKVNSSAMMARHADVPNLIFVDSQEGQTTMTETMVVFVTCESREHAEEIAEKVVGERLAACVNVVPGVRSCYVWEGKLTWSEEVLLLLKTTRAGFDALKERVRELHRYEVPEIVGMRVEAGLEKYLDWVKSGVGTSGLT